MSLTESENHAALDAEPVNVLRVYLGAVDHVLDVGQNVGEETGWKLLEVRRQNEE